MKKLLLIILLLLTVSSMFAQQEMPVQTDQLIIRFRSDIVLNDMRADKFQTGDPEVDRIISASNVLSIRKLNTGKKSGYEAVVIKVSKESGIKSMLDELNKATSVYYAEPDFIGQSSGVRGVTPDDHYYWRQWGLKNDGSFTAYPAIAGADIEMEEGWAIEEGDSSIIVGIIDSGCKLDHPEFQNRIWKNYDEIPGNGIDEGTNGYVDDTRGWDFANNDNNPTDDYGHGTNVAGIIGANGNNTIGYAGVDWNCKLMILKGINSQNWGYYSWWSDALHYAADNGANVVNMSVGGTDISSALQDAVNYALSNHVTIVACMMNTNSNTVYYPAAYPGVIAVGASNPDDTRCHPFFWDPSSGSNYGPHISVVAPGNYIYGLDYQSNTNYGSYWGGTSQATPHVCGLAALLLAQNPALTPAQIKNLIQSTAEDQVGDPAEDTPGWDAYYGYGRINAHNALLMISGLGEKDQADKFFGIYPNPNAGTFTINLAASPTERTYAIITNYLGQIILQAELKDQKNNISLSSSPGIYVLTVRQGNAAQSEKFIVR
jgi:thermitase